MVKTLYVLDRNKNIIGFISNNGSASTPFFNDKFMQILSNGAETFEFDVIADDKTNSLLIEGNYIMFEYNGSYKMFQIMTIEDDDSSYKIIKSCYCEIVGLELLNSYVRPCTIQGDIVVFFNTLLQDSNWQLGRYSSSLVNISKDINITESKSIYTLIQENINTYNSIEIEFRVEFENNKVIGYYIDVYEDGGRGKVTHKRFEHGTNVTGITRKGDITGFYSALIGEGKDKINFKDISWSKSNGDPLDKPIGEDFLLDPEANKMFNIDGKYITGLYKTDDTNAYDLLLNTYNKLQEVKKVKYSYEVEVGMKLEEFEQIGIGDTVYVIDNNFNPPILLEARVSQLEISFSNYTKNKCILANYKEVVSNIKVIKDGDTPFINESGNWQIGNFDTLVPAEGKTPQIGSGGNWEIGGVDTGTPASGFTVSISGQNQMKYLDKTTAPVPAFVNLQCKVLKGNVDITNICSYLWQVLINDIWTDIAGSDSSKIINYDDSFFLEKDICQIRSVATYMGITLSTEHTITKVYDNKYISQQEIFEKLTEGGNNFLYTDPETGKIYIDVTFARAGQLVANLIKGGVLTLGGTGDNTLSDYGVLRFLDYEGNNELARVDGGDAWFKYLSATEINVEKLTVTNIESTGITKQLTGTTNITIDSTIGNDDSEFIDEAVFETLQGAFDACPKNLGGRTINVSLKNDTTEDVNAEYFYNGRLRIYFEGHTLYGYYRTYMVLASFQNYGGTLASSSGMIGKIMPYTGFNQAGISTSAAIQGSTQSNMYSMNIYKATNLASGCTESAGLMCGDRGYVYISDVTPINCDFGFRSQANGIIYSNASGGKAIKYGFSAVSGGQIRLSNGKHTGGAIGNTYESSGGEVKYHGATFEGTETTGTNTSTPTATTYKISYTSNYGDTYRSSVYYSWKKDNTVREGDYGYGDCNGCWFFGTQFSELKGRTVTKVTIKVTRLAGGTSSSVTHTLKAHNHSSRPSGEPTYISGFSQTFGLSVGASTTITVTDADVLNAINAGTCKGFGLQSAYDKTHYSVCNGSATVTIYYQ